MNVVVFTGPTLSPREARQLLGEQAVYLPPAGQHDIYRVALRRPRIIALIDGYFQGMASVRHKEILWAISQGIHVFGAASMGALRAAELASFGMMGVGEIFAAYRDGLLEDDDAVAVSHGQRELDYAPASEALVNIHATLNRAVGQGVLLQSTALGLAELARELFHPLRHYPRLLTLARRRGLDSGQLARLEAWLPDNRVNLKRDDALALLQAVGQFLATDPPPGQVGYRFEFTSVWAATQLPLAPALDQGPRVTLEELLDELRLKGTRLDGTRETQLKTLAALAETSAHLTEYLSTLGDYPALLERARDKAQVLARAGWLRPDPAQLPLSPRELLDWYRQRLADSLDPQTLIDGLGYQREVDLYRALAGEYLYLQAGGPKL